MTAGKRRTAREMAVQMLYQSDLGGSPLPHIFNTFDLSEYLAREVAATEKRRKAGLATEEELDERAERARQRKRVQDAFLYAQDLVRGAVEHQEKVDDLIRSQADNWRLE